VHHPLNELGGADLAEVSFVRDYVQLGFDGPRLSLYVLPWIYRADALRPHDPGYADALIAQIGRRVAEVDELLDYGLVLDWDNSVRFAVPLDGTGASGPEAAHFTSDSSDGWAVWTPGEPAIKWSPPPVRR
jgi:hypothetical protein